MRISLLFFVLCAPFLMWGQEPMFSLNKGKIKQKEYFEEIPFEFVKGQIIVKVSINNETYRFSVDTGAPTSISDKLQSKLKLPIVHKLELIDSNNVKDSINVALLESISVGNIEIKNTPVLVVNSENTIHKCLNLDGIIGSNSLRNSIIQFSLPDKMLKITDNLKKLNLKRGNSQRFIVNPLQSSPYFILKLENEQKVKFDVLFDSGMESFFNISLRHFFAYQKDKIFRQIQCANGGSSIGLWGTSSDTLHYRAVIPRVKLGKMELQNLHTVTTQASDSRIGTKILEYAIVTLDYVKKRIYFTPTKDKIQDVFTPQFPIQPTVKNGKYQIGFIWDAKKYPNIHLGDEIISVNGFSCRGKTNCELLLKLANLEGEERKIKIIRAKAGSYTLGRGATEVVFFYHRCDSHFNR